MDSELLELLQYALDNLTFLRTEPECEYDFCMVCDRPEWNHSDSCSALVWEHRVKEVLQNGKG